MKIAITEYNTNDIYPAPIEEQISFKTYHFLREEKSTMSLLFAKLEDPKAENKSWRLIPKGDAKDTLLHEGVFLAVGVNIPRKITYNDIEFFEKYAQDELNHSTYTSLYDGMREEMDCRLEKLMNVMTKGSKEEGENE